MAMIVMKKLLNSRLNNMDESFLSSSTYGIIPCYWDSWDNKNFITLKLKKILDEYY